MDLRLLVVAGTYWLATIATLLAPPEAIIVLIVIATTVTALALRVAARWIVRAKVMYWVPHLVTCALTIAAATAVTTAWQNARGGHFGELTRVGAVAEISGRITSYPTISDRVYRVMSVEAVTGRGEGGPANAKVRLVGDEELAELPLHSTLTATVHLEPTDGHDEILAWARVITVTDSRAPEGIPGVIARHAEALRDNLEGYSGPARGLVPGLGIGDDSALPEKSATAMAAVNLTHLTAVSGAHISMVCAVVLFLVSARRRRRAVGACAVVLTLLVVATGGQPSVLRATIMGGMVLAAMWLRRPSSALPALGVAVIALLAHNPGLALAYGFVLSVTSTAAIIAFATPVAELLEPLVGRVASSMLSVPIVAHLACGPIIATLTESASVWSALANLLAAPAVPAGTILSLAALILAPVPLAGPVTASIAAWVVSWIDVVARTTAALPGSDIDARLVMGAYVGIMGAAWLVSHRIVTRRLLVGAGLAVALLAMIPPRTSTWDVVVCDVGQGSAALVADEGRVYLIDTGTGQERLPECVERMGVGIDVVVVSHAHADHDGNLAWVIETFDPVVWVGPGEASRYEHLSEKIVEVAAGQRTGAMEVLWPETARPCTDATCVNDQSVVIRAHLDQRILIPGDIEIDAQRALAGRDVQSEIIVVPHHGSARQDPGFARAVGAHTAVISVGVNSFGHPATSAIDLYAPTGRVHRTDVNGDIALSLDVEY